MARMGRPPIDINKDKFEQMCALQLTEEDIAFFFDASVDTIERWCVKTYGKTFAETFAQKRTFGKLSHRAAQFAMAKSNPTMSIWLGKQYFGQHDQINVEMNLSQSEASAKVKAMVENARSKPAGDI